MKKVFIWLAIALLAMATVGTATAQEGRVNTMCAGYTVDATQDPNGYDMMLTVPLPPDGFQSIYLEVDGQSHIDPEGDGNNVFRVPGTVFDIGLERHYYSNSMARSGGLIVYSCTDIARLKSNCSG